MGYTPPEIREQEITGFIKEVAAQKRFPKKGKDEPESSQTYFERAQFYYKKGKELEALEEALRAQQLDPANPEIAEFIEKVQRKLLSR